MSDAVDILDPCGCCEASIPQPLLYNRPGLPALAYRIGVHPAILRRMLARLPNQRIASGPRSGERPLAALTTRAPDDPAIALLDAAAVLMDVLTFYQERIANEGFLRTATERRSVLELARTIGYELNPGVAAGAFLAFIVDTATGAPPTAIVPQRTKVQSVPGPGELPQTFETGAEIIARSEWNELRPRLTRPQELAIGKTADKLYLLGVSTHFAGVVEQDVTDMYALDAGLAGELATTAVAQAVEAQQIFFAGANTGLKPGDILLLVGKRQDQAQPAALVRSVAQVIAQPERNRTQVDFEVEVTATPPKPPVFAPKLSRYAVAKLDQLTFTADKVKSAIVQQSWHESELSAFAAIQGWNQKKLALNINYVPPLSVGPPLSPAEPGVFAFRARLGIFGHNAPFYGSLPSIVMDAFHPWEPLSIWKDSRKIPSDQPAAEPYNDADIYLERNVPGLAGSGWVVLEQPVNRYNVYRLRSATDASVAGFGMSAKSVGLKLGKPDQQATELGPDDKLEEFKVRTTTAHIQSERLLLAELPIEDAIAAQSTELQLDRMLLGLQAGQPLAISGEREDLPGVMASEVVILADIVHAGGYTTLYFPSPGLKYAYVRKSMSLNANVARATHGETVTEVLGSGDGAQANQRFTLRKPPLTYTSSPDATGAQSSLELRVDGLQWLESPLLYGLAAADQRFIARTGDDGKTTVIFGDGATGARVPTGVENVTATYRSGIGLGGMVRAGKLTLLQSRPLGIRAVSNGTPATGAADPETRDSARLNAPLTVLTMDRIVSLRDFEDFARAFAGISKAKALALYRGETHWVQVTVASAAAVADDAGEAASPLASHQVDTTSELYTNLVTAMADACDPSQPFRVDSYQPVFFKLQARIVRDKRYLWEDVAAAVTAASQRAFAFAARTFAQPVTAAEVIAVIQLAPGVVAVHLEQLCRLDKPLPSYSAVLHAAPLRWEAQDAGPHLAELLLISPFDIYLEEMQP